MYSSENKIFSDPIFCLRRVSEEKVNIFATRKKSKIKVPGNGSSTGLPDFSWYETPKWEKYTKMTTRYTKSIKIYEMAVCKIDQIVIKFTNIFLCKTLQNLPKLEFLVKKLYHLAAMYPPVQSKEMSLKQHLRKCTLESLLGSTKAKNLYVLVTGMYVPISTVSVYALVCSISK
jgi:hypothetical protein